MCGRYLQHAPMLRLGAPVLLRVRQEPRHLQQGPHQEISTFLAVCAALPPRVRPKWRLQDWCSYPSSMPSVTARHLLTFLAPELCCRRSSTCHMQRLTHSTPSKRLLAASSGKRSQADSSKSLCCWGCGGTLSLGARCRAPFALEKLTLRVGFTARILAAADSGSCPCTCSRLTCVAGKRCKAGCGQRCRCSSCLLSRPEAGCCNCCEPHGGL